MSNQRQTYNKKTYGTSSSSHYTKHEIPRKENNNNIYQNTDFETLEKILNSKFDNFKVEINEKLNNIEKKLIDIEKGNNNFKFINENIKKISEEIYNISKNIKISTNDELKNKEKSLNNKETIYIDKNKNNLNKQKISDFIKPIKKSDLKINYYEPYEVENDREKIIESIKYNVEEYYLPEKEKKLNEIAGKFLYSVGGISRRALSLANYAYLDLFNEYKKYLENNKEWLNFNYNEDKRNFSIWVKNCLNEKNFFDYYSNLNLKIIEPYLYNEEKTDNILKGLFRDLISIQTKCLLSIPIVEAEFTNNNCQYEANIMFDIIFKGKKKLVNFCYLPGLISNGQLIKGGKYFVFTFIEGRSFQKKENLFDNEISKQSPILYSIPNFDSLKLKIEYKIKFITQPLICSELKPIYKLIRYEKRKPIEKESENGIFEIEKKKYKG